MMVFEVLKKNKLNEYRYICTYGWVSPVTQTRVIRTLVSRHFLSKSTCDIGYFDICFRTFNAQWQLNPDTCFPDTCFHKESRHLFPDTCFQKESRHLFPDTCFRQETRHLFPDTCFQQESRHLFPDTCFLELYPDTCFLTPVSPQKKQTPVSQHLFPPKKSDSCFRTAKVQRLTKKSCENVGERIWFHGSFVRPIRKMNCEFLV